MKVRIKQWTGIKKWAFEIPQYMHYSKEKNLVSNGMGNNELNRVKDNSIDENEEQYSDEHEIDMELRNDFDFIENTKYRALHGRE